MQLAGSKCGHINRMMTGSRHTVTKLYVACKHIDLVLVLNELSSEVEAFRFWFSSQFTMDCQINQWIKNYWEYTQVPATM